MGGGPIIALRYESSGCPLDGNYNCNWVVSTNYSYNGYGFAKPQKVFAWRGIPTNNDNFCAMFANLFTCDLLIFGK